MQTYYFVSAKKRELAPIYVRLSAGRKVDLIVKSGLPVNPLRWSNRTQSIKQRILTDADKKLIKRLAELKEVINTEFGNEYTERTKERLESVIEQFHTGKIKDAKTLNQYIDQYIKDAESGERKNKDAKDLAPGTIKAWKVFQRNFNEFQGIYTEKRLEWRKTNKKPIRTKKTVDFDSITIDLYHSFVKYLTDEGFNRGTIGRHIKELKMFMKKSLEDKLHNNREFEYSAFKGISSESFSIYLTKSELDKLYNIDLSNDNDLEKARDAFLTLCETGLRISDYSQVDVNIRTEDGRKYIYLNQHKTGGQVIIPLSIRLEGILKRYDGKLPRLPEQYINKKIKIIAQKAGFDEVLKWETEKYGKRFEKTAHKWELISNHTGRRSALTNWYLDGIDVISIMMISGHKTESSFMKYIKITKEQNAKKLALHPSFNRLTNVG